MHDRNVAEALRFLNTNASELADAVADRQFAADPNFARTFGPMARKRCVEDNRFHVGFLASAVMTENPVVFADYCGWAKVVLFSRGIAEFHLEQNLRLWQSTVRDMAPPAVVDVIDGYFDVALRRLSEYPTEPKPEFTAGENALRSEYISRVLAFDDEGAAQLIADHATDAEKLKDIYLNVLQPAQREIGRLWQVNTISVAAEHYATATAQRILHVLSRRLAPAGGQKMALLGLCPEGEQHCVGLQIVCDLARIEGWNAMFIGANTPTNAVVDLANKIRAKVIAVSVTTLLAVQNAASLIARLDEALPDTTVLVGGYAISFVPNLWRIMGADAYADDALAAMQVLHDIRNRAK